MANTKKTLKDLFLQNTGQHMLDSGSAYGRHWQRNQEKTEEELFNQPALTFEVRKKGDTRNDLAVPQDGSLEEIDFARLKEAIAEIKEQNVEAETQTGLNQQLLENCETSDGVIQVDEILPHYDTYAVLRDYVLQSTEVSEWDEIINQEWLKHCKENEDADFLDFLDEYFKELGSHGLTRDNTYNMESFLSQEYIWTLPGQIYDPEMPSIVGIEIHQGCDIRGGYSDMYFFDMDEVPIPPEPAIEEVYFDDNGQRKIVTQLMGPEIMRLSENKSIFWDAKQNLLFDENLHIYF